MRKILIVAGLIFVPSLASAQESLPVAIEARGAYAVPTGDWAEDDTVENGFGFGGAVLYEATPTVGVYAGWDRVQFNIDTDSSAEGDATDSGFRAGVQLNIPPDESTGLVPFVQAGAIYNKTSIGASSSGVSIDLDSDSALGFEVAAGVGYDAGSVTLRPSVFYRSHSAEFDVLAGSGDDDGTVSYFGALVGVAIGG